MLSSDLSVIFNNKDIIVFYKKREGNFITRSVKLVYFDHAGDRDDLRGMVDNLKDRAIRPGEAFAKRGFDTYLIISKTVKYYYHVMVENALKAISNHSGKCDYVFIGYSMGGTGAINSAPLMNARVLAFQPAYDLADDIPMLPVGKIALDDNLNGEFYSAIKNNECNMVEGVIFYDPYYEIDKWHAENIVKKTKLVPAIAPYCGHSVSTAVNKVYKIADIVVDFINGIDVPKKVTQIMVKQQSGNKLYIIDKLRNGGSNLLLNNLPLKVKIECLFEAAKYEDVILDAECNFKNFIEKCDGKTIEYVSKSYLRLKKVNEAEIFFRKLCENISEDSKLFPAVIGCLSIIYHLAGNVDKEVLNYVKLINFKCNSYYVMWHFNKFSRLFFPGWLVDDVLNKNLNKNQLYKLMND